MTQLPVPGEAREHVNEDSLLDELIPQLGVRTDRTSGLIGIG
jgi:hypothetical protein